MYHHVMDPAARVDTRHHVVTRCCRRIEARSAEPSNDRPNLERDDVLAALEYAAKVTQTRTSVSTSAA
jgi:hypothetical protein